MKLLHELISDHSVRLGDKTAVKDHRSEMTYGELEKYSSMFSRKLQAIGVKKGDFVAIYVPRIKEVVTGAISVLRAGGIYVPFDDGYPVKRLEYMLKDANAAAILTTREQGIKISGSQVLQYNVFKKIAEAAEVSYEQLWSREEYESIIKAFAERGEHIQRVLPISSRQDEMLFEQLIFPDSDSFRNVVYLQMDSLVSEEHLREALDIIALENEELRELSKGMISSMTDDQSPDIIVPEILETISRF